MCSHWFNGYNNLVIPFNIYVKQIALFHQSTNRGSNVTTYVQPSLIVFYSWIGMIEHG